MKELNKLIKNTEDATLTSQDKLRMKNRIMSRISEYEMNREPSFVQKVKSGFTNISLSPVKRAMIKERIFAVIENSGQKKYLWTRFFAFNKKLISMSLVAVMIMGTFSFLNVNTSVVFADSITQFGNFIGEVSLERDGEILVVEKGMEIFVDDKIITGDGQVEISYLDDSVTRLAPNSSLVVNQLDRKSFVQSYVEVSLEDGRVWSRVVNLVEQNSAFVVEANDVYATAKKAAFDVSVENGNLEIEVFNNTVDVRSGTNVSKLGRGKKMSVDKEVSSVVVAEQDEWVTKNLEDDKAYVAVVEERLLAAKIEAVGVEVNEDVNYDSSIREKAVQFLTFDDVKRKKFELELAEKNFVVAQVKLHDESLTVDAKTEAEVAIGNFAIVGEEFAVLVGEVALTDESYADELDVYLEEKIMLHKKDLSVVKPDSPLYEAKQVVDELQLTAASDEAEAAKIKLVQASEKLAELEEVVEFGASDAVVADLEQQVEEDVTAAVEVAEAIGGEELIGEADVLLDAIADVVEDPVVVNTVVVEEDPIDDGSIQEGPYGVKIQGDKALPPIF